MPSPSSWLGRKLVLGGGGCLPEVGTALSLPGQLTTFPPASAFPVPDLGRPSIQPGMAWPELELGKLAQKRRAHPTSVMPGLQSGETPGAMEGGAPPSQPGAAGWRGELGHQGVGLPQHPGSGRRPQEAGRPGLSPRVSVGAASSPFGRPTGIPPDLTPGDTSRVAPSSAREALNHPAPGAAEPALWSHGVGESWSHRVRK